VQFRINPLRLIRGQSVVAIQRVVEYITEMGMQAVAASRCHSVGLHPQFNCENEVAHSKPGLQCRDFKPVQFCSSRGKRRNGEFRLSSSTIRAAVSGNEVSTASGTGESRPEISRADVVVIGAGIGGLCCAALLAKYGYKVVVCESHDIAGGAGHAFERQGFHFDSGPSFHAGLSIKPSINPLKQVNHGMPLFIHWI
jgi:heterodisulfide reductase subunit A-like polyferredoxin